jgi:hypothetical protein
MVFGGKFIRTIVAAGIVSLFIISLINDSSILLIINRLGLRYRYIAILLFLGISMSLYLIRKYLDKFLFCLFGCFFIGSLFTSANPSFKEQQFNFSNKPNDKSLPPYIHIILDEHIGIEGIPPDEDPNHEFANSLKNRYIKNGFQVYGRAFSRYSLSINSFSSFLGLGPLSETKKYYYGNSVTQYLEKNTFFDELSKKGYHINVMQSSYLDLCSENEIKHCLTYSLVTSSHLWSPDFTLLMYSNVLSTMRLNNLYTKIQQSKMGKVFNLPKAKLIANPTSSEATYQALPKVIKWMSEAEMGNAYFIPVVSG